MLAENIRKIRKEFGLSQEAFAAQIGVSVGVITNIELDRLKRPETKIPLIRLISEKFGIPMEWILADDPGPVPLPELDERDMEVAKIGEILQSNDPLVKGFLAWYGQRTDAERKQICRYVLDFAEKFKEAQE